MADETHYYFAALRARAQAEPNEACLNLHSISQTITFAQMEKGVANAARQLGKLGIGRSQIVLIFAHHDAGTFFAFFGAQALGAIPSFMPPPTPRQPLEVWRCDHRALVERIAPALVVCDESIAGHVLDLGAPHLLTTSALSQWEIGSEDLPFAPVAYDPDSIALLQHSSGTTGLKKGVTVTYRQLQAQIESYASSLNMGSRDCVISWLPIYHDMGLIAATLLPFMRGLPITLIDTMRWLEEPSQYLELLASKPNSFSWLPNFAFAFLAQRGRLPPEANLIGVRAIINCSEPCKWDAMESFRERFAAHGLPETSVQVCYAMAEYVFAATQTPADTRPKLLRVDEEKFDSEHRAVVARNSGRAFVSVGKPLPETNIRIGANLEDGLVGEVWVRGPSLCEGYFAAPEITARRFVDGWYRTGDLGFVQNDELYITGREDDVIIVRGKNIYAHDVEMLATGTGSIRAGRAVALGVDDAGQGTQKLVVIAEIASPLVEKHAARAIRRVVKEAYGLSPGDVVLVAPDTLIKTTSGKISRSENLKRYIAGALISWEKQTTTVNSRTSNAG